jgi:hypothetical protein
MRSPNTLRVLLATLAHVFVERLLAVALQGTEPANANSNTRRMRLYLASNWPSAPVFAQDIRAVRSL